MKRVSAPSPPDLGNELKISVVVATWRRPDDLGRCLSALAAQTWPPIEIVVVARSDDCPTWAALRSATLQSIPLRAVAIDVPGVVAALNAGLDAAGGAIIAITDDDAAPRPDWLERIHAHLRLGPDAGAVGGRDHLHPVEREARDGSVVGTLRRHGRLVGNHHLGAGGPRDVDFLKGVNFAVRRSALGGLRLDPRLRGGGAQVHWELGLCLALRRSGWRLVYDPAVAVDHYPAQRFDAGEREHPTPAALGDEVHNEMYGLVRWLPLPAAVTALAYGVFVGSRRAPGLLVAAERALRGDRTGLAERLLTAQRARAAALRTLRQARGSRLPQV